MGVASPAPTDDGAATSPHLPHLLPPPAATTTTTVGAAGAGSCSAMILARHEGHEAQVRSQASTHGTWKPWPHSGSTRRLSPWANSARHIAHSDEDDHAAAVGFVAGDDDPEGVDTAKETVGSASMAFFLSPLGGGDEWSEVEVRRRRQAHRETRASPRTQTSAQSSDARITTMLESTAIVCCCCCCGGVRGAGEEEDISPAATTAVRCRKFAGARMVLLSLLRLVRVSCPWRFEHVGFYTLVGCAGSVVEGAVGPPTGRLGPTWKCKESV